jgi:hypothetical protein
MKNYSSSQSLDWPRKDVAILLGFWFFSLILNFDKAFHIDDTAHLEMARWIAQQPLRPLSGLLICDKSAATIFLSDGFDRHLIWLD